MMNHSPQEETGKCAKLEQCPLSKWGLMVSDGQPSSYRRDVQDKTVKIRH